MLNYVVGEKKQVGTNLKKGITVRVKHPVNSKKNLVQLINEFSFQFCFHVFIQDIIHYPLLLLSTKINFHRVRKYSYQFSLIAKQFLYALKGNQYLFLFALTKPNFLYFFIEISKLFNIFSSLIKHQHNSKMSRIHKLSFVPFTRYFKRKMI